MPTRSARRERLLLAATLCCSVVVGLVMMEVLLRVFGDGPAVASHFSRPDEPATNVPDPVLGWRAMPGAYRIPAWVPDAPPITMTIWPDGSRATSERQVKRSRQVVLVGDSFTQGWAISDDETFAWKLQARLPDVEIVNYGTAGYNGVQSLGRLEEDLSAREDPPALVIYGFNDDQERRNVADGSWVGVLALAARRAMVRLPYCLLDGADGLACHPPEGVPLWPLRDRLAIVHLLERVAFRVAVRGRGRQQRRVTELLLDRMNAVVRARGSRFLVVLLHDAQEVAEHYTAYLSGRGIDVLDCRIPGSWLGLTVPGEGHPNGIANDKWAECLARALGERLARR